MSLLTVDNIREIISGMILREDMRPVYWDLRENYLDMPVHSVSVYDPLEKNFKWQELANTYTMVSAVYRRAKRAEAQIQRWVEHSTSLEAKILELEAANQQWVDYGASLEEKIRELESSNEQWLDHSSHFQVRVQELVEEQEKSNRIIENMFDNFRKSIRLHDTELGRYNQLVEWYNQLQGAYDLLWDRQQVAKQDQATQTMVSSTFAVEVQTSAEDCEGGCHQTFGGHGCQHECCEKAVQTAYSYTKLASIVCWRCGEHGHYRSHCWRRRRRCFACKKVGHIRRFCPSRAKVEQNHSPGGSENAEAADVHAVSKMGGRRRMGGHSAGAQAPTPPD